MPKGKKNHKGLHRRFTAPEEIERQMKEGGPAKPESGSGSESESEVVEKDKGTRSGDAIQSLIEVSNPNYQKEKNKKFSELDNEELPSDPNLLSRRQREEVEAERARKEYERLHMLGKTAEAQADLARLALVRREREEAARKREAEKEAKEAAKAVRNVDSQNKLQGKPQRGPTRGRNARKNAAKVEAEKTRAKNDQNASKQSS